MAFADITTELEELISKCEFENKQYVRAISQETQLLENINQEITFKNDEMVNLQSAIVQTERETSHFERQCEYHITNIENLKKTNDVLTEHIHAMKSKFEDIKAKRHEEKYAHEKQLQHFRDKWTEYKQTYDKFPLAVKLKKIQDDIRCSEENTERVKQETESMKERIKRVENENYWNSMDWKTFIIKLAENRLLAIKLKNEIDEIKNKKKSVEISKDQQRPKDNRQNQELSNDNNIKKMTELHIPESNQTNVENNKQQMEVCSPMISVLSDREDDQTEVMQTDNTHHAELRDFSLTLKQTDQMDSLAEANRTVQQQQQNPQVRNNFQENSMLNQLFPQPKLDNQPFRMPGERTNQQEMSKMQTSPSLPFVSYSKAGTSGNLEEKVDLHLNTTRNKPSQIQGPQKSFISQPPSIPKINQTNIPPPSSSNRPNPQNMKIPTPQPIKLPSQPSQVPQPNTKRGAIPVPVPTLSQRMPTLSPSVRGSRSLNFQPRMPVLNRPGNFSKAPASSTTAAPKQSPVIPSLSQPSVQNRSYVPLSNVPRIESRPMQVQVNKPQASPLVPNSPQVSTSQYQLGSMNAGKQLQSDRSEDTTSRPAMLKEQTTRVLQSLQPQPSPCPPPATHNEKKNKAEFTAIQLQANVPFSQSQQLSTDVNQKSASPGQNMLDGTIYHQPLKDSPQKSSQFKQQNAKSPHKSPGKGKSKSNSPFNIEMHRQKLEELKRSPGYPQYMAERRMFQSQASITNEEGMHAGGDNKAGQNAGKPSINTAVFGGACQPTGDDTYTATPLISSASEGNFNLFNNFMDSPGQHTPHFISFGQENKDSPLFSFNFDQKETTQSPDIGFSFFEKRNLSAASPGFNFNFDAPDNSLNKGNAMSFLGDNAKSSDQEGNKSDGFFKLNFGQNDDDDNSSFFSSFGKSDGKEKPFSLFGSPSGNYGQEKPMILFEGGDNAKEGSESDGNFKLNFDQNEKGGDNVLNSLFGGSLDREQAKEGPTFLFNNVDKEGDKGQDFSFFNSFESNRKEGGLFDLFGNTDNSDQKNAE